MDISVIIPIYNAGKYLAACLQSVTAAIASLEAEVLLIDDGSTDGSGSVAEEAARKDARFRYVRTENRGVSAARNTGVAMAQGRYLRFVDADDLLEPASLREMLRIAQQEQSDITLCRFVRIKGKRTMVPAFIETALRGVTAGPVRLFSCPSLMQNSFCTNLLISREFYAREKLTFLEGHIFEDIMWSVRAMSRANRISVLQKVGYLWRIREDETPSITQNRTDLRNLREKIYAINEVRRYIGEQVPDPAARRALLSALSRKALNCDFTGYVNRLSSMPRAEAQEFVREMGRFLQESVERDALRAVSLKWRQLWAEIEGGDLDRVIRFNNYKNHLYPHARVVRAGESPAVPRLEVPGDYFTLEDRDAAADFAGMPPAQCLTGAEVSGQVLTLTGYLYFPRLSIAEGEQQVRLILMNALTKATLEVRAEPVAMPELTAKAGLAVNFDDCRTDRYCYDGAGWRAEVDLAALRDDPAFAGDNLAFLAYRNPVLDEIAPPLRGCSPEVKAAAAAPLAEGDGFSCRIAFGRLDTFTLQVEHGRFPPRAKRHSEAEYQALAVKNRQLARRAKSLSGELQKAQEEAAAQGGARAALAQEALALREELSGGLMREERLRSEIEALQASGKEAGGEIARLRRSVSGLEAELAERRAREEELRKESADLRDRCRKEEERSEQLLRERDEILSSLPYRLGRAIAWPARAVRRGRGRQG